MKTKNKFSTITFGEALEDLRHGRTNYMIRAAWLNNVDFINSIIILSNLDTYIKLDHSCSEGCPKILWLWKRKDDGSGGMIGKYAKIESDDILAIDWLDLSDWRIAKNSDEYKEILEKARLKEKEEEY